MSFVLRSIFIVCLSLSFSIFAQTKPKQNPKTPVEKTKESEAIPVEETTKVPENAGKVEEKVEATPTPAEEDHLKDLDSKNGIVVTGSRGERRLKDSTVATEVISKKRIEQTGARNLGEVLETQLGISVLPNALGGSQVQMLGLDSKYVLFLVDGQRIAGRLNNTVDLTRFKVQNIERIEIVKGSSSALYGADAIGGVINIITRQAEKPEHYQFRATYGNGRQIQFGTQGEKNMIADVGFRNPFVAANFTGGFNQSAGYDLDPSTKATTGNAFQDSNVGSNMTFNPDGKFQVKTGVFYLSRFQQGVISQTSGGVFDRTNATNDFLGLGALEYSYGKKNMISFRGNYARWENKFSLNQRGSDELDSKELTNDQSSQGTIQLDHELTDRHMMTVGFESYANELESDRLTQRFAYRTRRAVFLQDEWTAYRNGIIWRIIPGIRHDVDSQFGGQTTPKIATRLDLTSQIILRASYGVGFRPPTFQELYLRFENPGVGYVVEGNPQLRPEKSRTVNADIEYNPFKSLSLSMSVFRNVITDLIQYNFGTNSREFATFQLTNIKEAYTRGAEFGMRTKFLKYNQFELGYNYTETRDLTSDRPLEGRPVHQATANYFLLLPQGWEFALRTKWVGRRPFFSQTTDFAGASTSLIENRNDPFFNNNRAVYGKEFPLINVRFEKKFFDGRMSLFLGVDNVLDKYELIYNPIRPRFYYGGLQAQF
ncbi:TonB-dependent outer membrane receptor [Leptospira ryugenii]|uniref:TonB-dependent outer membrane receptor n=1 Tax=Leptospira ryugenii TaxID=1917863 RepID=A0A2P2E3D8_9LEPT|nr:TonB-dependent receptor [Leptospira ryugenii]GBF51381.1 TonB-dependent outer membrane receptor [Leptospira ryugenii]